MSGLLLEEDNDVEVREFERKLATATVYIHAWCYHCDLKWQAQGEAECVKEVKKDAYQHARRTGHRVIVRVETTIEYNG